MATLKMQGLDEYIEMLSKLEGATNGFIKRAVYDGAAVVADAVSAAIDNLPEVEGYQPPAELPIRGVTREQKRGLKEGLGLTKMQDENGYINTKLGFNGYNSVKTKRFPQGQPNALIARAINSGSSARSKNPFVNNAVRSSQGKAEAAMAARFDEDLKQFTE